MDILDNSTEAADIDRELRDTVKSMQLSILTMGIRLTRIKEERLYRELGFRSLSGYITKLSIECKMDRSSFFKWLSIGEAWRKYHHELEQIGFNDSDGPTKLPYIGRALEKMRKEEVFDNIKDMSVREFKALAGFHARKSPAFGSTAESKTGKPGEEKRIKAIGEKLIVQGNLVLIGGRQAMTLSSSLGKRTYAYFKKVILAAGKALENGGVILPVVLADMKEARCFAPIVSRMKMEMRKKERRYAFKRYLVKRFTG